MRACLFGTYNRGHSANRVLAGALEACGYEVVEIHRPLWERTRDKPEPYFAPLGLLRLAFAWTAAALALAREWQASGGAPLAVVGFNGQLDVLLLRLLAFRHGPHVVFAPLVSITETLVDDRGVYRAGSLGARALRWLDRLACAAADRVVVDTRAHADYFVERLGVPREKLSVCHLGVDTRAFPLETPVPGNSGDDIRESQQAREASRPGDGCEVLYFGQYLPLHGLDVIAGAVEALADRDGLRFVFVGTGEGRAELERRVRASGARCEFLDWVDYERLAECVAHADIVVGIFGASAKARMVVPNKVYQAAAVGRAIVTADTPAVRELFRPGEHLEVCDADPRSLAGAVERLAGDPQARARLGRGARALMSREFSERALAERWSPAFAAGEGVGEPVRVTAAVLHYRDPRATLACLDSCAAAAAPEGRIDLALMVVDNRGRDEEAVEDNDDEFLERGLRERKSVRVLRPGVNLGYAGGCNLAMREAFASGAECVLLLNDDTLVAPGAIEALAACARTQPAAALLGPTVVADEPGGTPASVGERCLPALAWVPRTLLRYRRRRQRPYPVRGLLGCALLMRRDGFEKLGGMDESYFAYYEEVDACLRAPSAGLSCYLVPEAEVAHRGHRGFAGGMTEVSAYLKARNLWLLGHRRASPLGRLLFVPGYALLLAASAAVYAARGRGDLARALWAGARAGVAGETGAPPDDAPAGGSHVGSASQRRVETAR